MGSVWQNMQSAGGPNFDEYILVHHLTGILVCGGEEVGLPDLPQLHPEPEGGRLLRSGSCR